MDKKELLKELNEIAIHATFAFGKDNTYVVYKLGRIFESLQHLMERVELEP